MGTAAQEIELKFAVPADKAEAVWKAVSGKAAADDKRLVSTYFDTVDHALGKAGFGLRVRSDGRRKIQTLKGPDPQGFARAEYETPVTGPGVDVAVLAETPVAPLLEGAEIAPLFRVEVRRRTVVLTQGAAEVEVCIDTGFIQAGNAREEISEIELELKSGRPHALFAIGRRLTARRPLTLSLESKAERGYRLIGAREPKGPTVGPHMDAAAALTAIGEAALAELSVAALALEAEITPKRVHALRVGIRRLRSAGSAFKPMLSDPWSEALAEELKWLAGSLDEVRDLDVLALSAADADPAFHAILERARAAARDRLAEALSSPRARALPLRVAEWLTVGSWRISRNRTIRLARERPLLAFAAEALDHRLGKLDAGDKLSGLTPADRHERRIQIKKLRYAAEAFGPAFDAKPKRRKRMIAALKATQEALGALNDDAVGRELAHRLVAESGDAEAAFAAGAAFAPDPRRDAKRLKAAQASWRDIFDITPFWR